MAKNKLGMLALAALLLVLALCLAARYGARPGVKPVLPAAPAAGIAAGAPGGNVPAEGVPREKKSRRRRLEKRVSRVSALQDPGEALVSGVGRATVPAAGAAAGKN